MTMGKSGIAEGTTETLESRDTAASNASSPRMEKCRIALLTPYSGGNLGDAAIQDAMIANLRLRLPSAQFSGITLNCENFLERHGVEAFPLCATGKPFYGMTRRHKAPPEVDEKDPCREIKSRLQQLPLVGRLLKSTYAGLWSLGKEIRHCFQAYRFLRTHDLLVVSGGGQLDEEWGGAWGHPFALFKWALLAWMARVPCAFASVGACKAHSVKSRFFLSAALRIATYRSYRDQRSLEFASGLLTRATGDSVVPDVAFSLPKLLAPIGISSTRHSRKVVAISPIVYAKPGNWPHEDGAVYQRYLAQMSTVVSRLMDEGYFLAIVWSSVADREAIDELLGYLSEESKMRLAQQVLIATIANWKDLLAVLQDADFVIASRLHSTILGFVAMKPTIAISFDPKVDEVMKDLGQTDYLLQIRDFSAEDVIQALHRIEHQKNVVMAQIGSYRQRALSVSESQYDTLAGDALTSHRRRTRVSSNVLAFDLKSRN